MFQKAYQPASNVKSTMDRTAIGSRNVALLAVMLALALFLVLGSVVTVYLSTVRNAETTGVMISPADATTTTTNCNGPDSYCGPYTLLIDTSLTSSQTLGRNESRLAGNIECTHNNLSPPSTIELRWAMPNPVDVGWPAGTNVTTIHIVTTGIDWTPNWTLNAQGKQATSYSFMIPIGELDVMRGMSYTVQAVANWSSGPLSHSTPADTETVTITTQ